VLTPRTSEENRTILNLCMRIASLLPSATEIVALLGLDKQLVGVSADSDWPLEVVSHLPVLNSVSIATDSMTSREIDQAASVEGHRGLSLYHVDPDLLRSVRPDLILTQETCEVCAVSRRDVELATQTLGYAPQVLSLSPVTLDQVFDDIESVARLADVGSDDQISSLRTRVENVKVRAAGLTRQRVFCMEWLDPPYTAGHWVPQMVEIAGGRDELGSPAGPSRRIDWQDIVAYAPDVIVLMPCSLDLDRVAAEFALLRSLPGWFDVPAVQSGQVFAGHTHLFSRSGPRLVDGVEVLARMLHPDVFDAPLPAGQALKMSASGEQLEAYR
jgi:iron complex transport system substrate-binding protein